MNYKAKRLFQNLLVLVSSLLFALIVLELGIRIIKADYSLKNLLEKKKTLFKSTYPSQYDLYLGWIPKEGFSGNKNIWKTTVTILENGIRSNGKEIAKEIDTSVTILAVGDSFTFGDGVSDWDTWPALLEKISRKKVINGGVFGYALDQIFLRANKLAKIYKPNILIISFIPDNIYRCQLSQRTGVSKPYFDIFNNNLVLRNVPVPAPPQPKDLSWARKIFGCSYLVYRIAEWVFPDYWFQDNWRSTKVHSPKDAEQIAYLLFRHLRDIIQTDNLKHIIVLVQYSENIKPKNSILIDKIITGINDESIKVVDLRQPFFRIMQQDKKRWKSFFKGHMTPEGNYFVACELQKVLSGLELN